MESAHKALVWFGISATISLMVIVWRICDMEKLAPVTPPITTISIVCTGPTCDQLGQKLRGY